MTHNRCTKIKNTTLLNNNLISIHQKTLTMHKTIVQLVIMLIQHQLIQYHMINTSKIINIIKLINMIPTILLNLLKIITLSLLKIIPSIHQKVIHEYN
jgi:hypothetical protein